MTPNAQPTRVESFDRSALAQLLEPPYTDPYVRWCGRGGAARLPPIPISGTKQTWRLQCAMSALGGEAENICSQREFRLLCRFWDAGMTGLSTRCGGRRSKSAKARNRGKWGTGGAAGAYGNLAAVRWFECRVIF